MTDAILRRAAATFIRAHRLRAVQWGQVQLRCNNGEGCTATPTMIAICPTHGGRYTFSLLCDEHMQSRRAALEAAGLRSVDDPPRVMCPPIGARP